MLHFDTDAFPFAYIVNDAVWGQDHANEKDEAVHEAVAALAEEVKP